MVHYQVTDPDRPERFGPTERAQVIAGIRQRVLQLDVDHDGNVHRRDILDALDDEQAY